MIFNGSNLRNKRNEVGLTQEQLSEKTGISRPHISLIENGAEQPLTTTVTKFAQALNCSVSELYGEPQKKKDWSDLKNGLVIPVIASPVCVCAGNGNDYCEVQYETDGNIYIESAKLSAFYSSQSLTAIKVEGDSMSKTGINNGDWVIFDNSKEVAGVNIYVVCYENRLMVKWVHVENGNVILRSSSDGYPDIKVTPENNFKVLGRVVGLQPQLVTSFM